MIKWVDLEVNNVYRNDNSSVYYKVIALENNYGIILYYENNYKIATLKFINPNEDFNNWYEVDDESDCWFLKWLEYEDENTLKIN